MTTEKTMPGIDRVFLGELARGAEKTFENAEALFREAEILSAAGAFARALFLHQISLEECAKIEAMGAWATSILAGIPVDKKNVLAGLTRHGNKNRTNAYILGSRLIKSTIQARRPSR
jgi:AbiV family abortive infection protein